MPRGYQASRLFVFHSARCVFFARYVPDASSPYIRGNPGHVCERVDPGHVCERVGLLTLGIQHYPSCSLFRRYAAAKMSPDCCRTQ